MAWTLCSKQDIIDLHPITEAELKDSWSDEVEGLIKEFMGETYMGASQVIADEWHDGDGTNILRTMHIPIATVETLVINDTTFLASDYVVFPTFIELRYQKFPTGTLNVKVSYTTAPTVTQVVRLAAASMIVAIANYKKRMGADASLKWSSADQKVGEESPNQNVGLTSHLAAIMKRILRRPRLLVH